ncbi:hypothetical protein CONPUDRAFT_58495 [Coniophora puteana RWD-64-598 SS2]|uniref:Uncharacterized protein n=1 Tax=Coniophora puteana (strain RWD-64-598) TaxID=741705 RepID=A0A5M3MM81_CONPW|nr:uncharacterized protein CONPUDRAFT_58495 [Coniophora puteana RWD-64-598 SS2]EIW79691.1 hypothetical protein CONPUDRAFT_58495 [Coniophora puteana RWD-64-598 SS2]
MFAKLVTVASLAASALATVFITSPTAASSFPAGKNATVSWIDDGSAPSLAQFGNATIAVYVGNVNQQVRLTAAWAARWQRQLTRFFFKCRRCSSRSRRT